MQAVFVAATIAAIVLLNVLAWSKRQKMTKQEQDELDADIAREIN